MQVHPQPRVSWFATAEHLVQQLYGILNSFFEFSNFFSTAITLPREHLSHNTLSTKGPAEDMTLEWLGGKAGCLATLKLV